jgi:hypothetical protein
LNIMASIHNRKLISALMRELREKDEIIEKFGERMIAMEDELKEIKGLIQKGKSGIEMAHCTAWILDISIEQNRALIWIKTTEENILLLNYLEYSMPEDWVKTK